MDPSTSQKVRRAHTSKSSFVLVCTSSSFGFLQKAKYYVLDLIHLLGLVELVLLLRSKSITAIVLSLILVLYPIPNYLIHLGPRQSYPVDWILTLLACALLVRITAHTDLGVRLNMLPRAA